MSGRRGEFFAANKIVSNAPQTHTHNINNNHGARRPQNIERPVKPNLDFTTTSYIIIGSAIILTVVFVFLTFQIFHMVKAIDKLESSHKEPISPAAVLPTAEIFVTKRSTTPTDEEEPLPIVTHGKEIEMSELDHIFKELNYFALLYNKPDKVELPPKKQQGDNEFFVMEEKNSFPFPWVLGKCHNFTVTEMTVLNPSDIVDIFGKQDRDQYYATMSKKVNINVDPEYCIYRSERLKNEKDTITKSDHNFRNYNPKKFVKTNTKSTNHNPNLKCECNCQLQIFKETLSVVNVVGEDESRLIMDKYEKLYQKNDFFIRPETKDCTCRIISTHDDSSFIINLLQEIDIEGDSAYIEEHLAGFTCSIVYISKSQLCPAIT